MVLVRMWPKTEKVQITICRTNKISMPHQHISISRENCRQIVLQSTKLVDGCRWNGPLIQSITHQLSEQRVESEPFPEILLIFNILNKIVVHRIGL